MKRKIASLLLALLMVLCLVPGVATAEEPPFSAKVGGQACAVTKSAKSYTAAWPVTTVDVYEVTIPAAATSVTLDFDTPTIVYNYTASGEYLSGFYASEADTDPLYTGESESSVSVDADSDGVMDYIQVQDPYHTDWTGGTLRYAVTFCYASGSTPADATGSGIVPAGSALEAYTKTGNMLYADAASLVSGSGQSDWKALGLARAGKTLPESYINSAKTNMNGPAPILALTAIGIMPSQAQITNMINTYSYSGFISCAANELLALDACGAETDLRDTLLNHLLTNRQKNGAWGYTYMGTFYEDVDSTCMAVQALAPYYEANSTVKTAVDEALRYIKKQQNSDGTFGAWGPSAETTSQVIVALTALGLDPTAYCGKSCIDGLLTLSVDTGGFTYCGAFNEISTTQGYYALAAYYRYLAGKTSLYDMRQEKTADYTGSLGSSASFTGRAVKADLGSGKEVNMDTALVAKLKALSGDVKLTVAENAAHTAAQTAAIGTGKRVVDIDLTVGGTAVNDLGGGRLTVTIPADTATAKKSGYSLVAKCVAADGKMTAASCRYDVDGNIVLELSHLSTYVIYTKAVSSHSDGTGTAATVQSPKTGDMGIVLYAAMSAVSYIGSAALLRKRKEIV